MPADLPPPQAEWSVIYANEGDEIPEGFEDDGSFVGCHHGAYSTRIVSDRRQAQGFEHVSAPVGRILSRLVERLKGE